MNIKDKVQGRIERTLYKLIDKRLVNSFEILFYSTILFMFICKFTPNRHDLIQEFFFRSSMGFLLLMVALLAVSFILWPFNLKKQLDIIQEETNKEYQALKEIEELPNQQDIVTPMSHQEKSKEELIKEELFKQYNKKKREHKNRFSPS